MIRTEKEYKIILERVEELLQISDNIKTKKQKPM